MIPRKVKEQLKPRISSRSENRYSWNIYDSTGTWSSSPKSDRLHLANHAFRRSPNLNPLFAPAILANLTTNLTSPPLPHLDEDVFVPRNSLPPPVPPLAMALHQIRNTFHTKYQRGPGPQTRALKSSKGNSIY